MIVSKKEIHLAIAAMAMLGAYVMLTGQGALGGITGEIAADEIHPLVPQQYQPLVASSAAYSVGQSIATDQSLSIGKKIQEDHAFEVRFLKVQKGAEFRLEFFHNAQSAQPVRVEGISSYALSNPSPAPYEAATLIVPLVSGKVPSFRLRVGSSSEVFEFGETSFAPEAAEPQATFTPQQTSITECTTLSTPGEYELAQDIATTGTCINISTSGADLNCQGFRIIFGSGGGSNVYGVVAVGRSNLTIRNCIINDNNTAGNTGIGINLTRTGNSTILNNSIFTNGTTDNYGILLFNSTMINITNNTVVANGTTNDNIGIYLLNRANNNTIEFNNITTRPAGAGTENNGIRLETASGNNTIRNNTIVTGIVGAGAASPAGDNYGIYLVSSSSNVVANNSVRTNGADTQVGIRVSTGRFNRIFNNFIVTNGTISNFGIDMVTATDSNVTSNIIRTHGSLSGNDGIRLQGSSGLNVSQNVIITNGTDNNIGINLETTSSSASEFSFNNVTTSGDDDTVNNYGISITASGNGNRFIANNITSNGLDSHGILISDITLGVNFTQNAIYPDGEGLLVASSSPTSQSVFSPHNIDTSNTINNTAIFYYGGRGSSPACPSPGTTLNSPTASHISLIGCVDVTINGAVPHDAITLVNTNLSDVNNSRIVGAKYGVRVFAGARNTTLFNNTIATFGEDDNYGIWVDSSHNHTISSNNVSTNGTSDNYGIFLDISNNNTVVYNIVNTNATFSSGFTAGTNTGIRIESSGSNNVSYNNISTGSVSQSSGGGSNVGILLSEGSHSAVNYNRVQTTGGVSSNHGIQVSCTGSCARSTFIGNTINTTAAEGGNNHGIVLSFAVLGSVTTQTAVYNVIGSSGITTLNHGISLNRCVACNISHNNITAVLGNGIDVDGGTVTSRANIAFNRIFATGTSNLDSIEISDGGLVNYTGNIIEVNGSGTNIGIQVGDGSVRNRFISNTIRTTGTGANNYGIIVSNALNNITGNNISTNGTNTNIGIYISNGAGNIVDGNNIEANGTSFDNYGVLFEFASINNTVSGNNITTGGSSEFNYGMYLLSSGGSSLVRNNTISDNFIFGTPIGIVLSGAVNNTFVRNNLTGNAVGMYLQSLSVNNTISTNRLFGNTDIGLNISNSHNNTIFDNFMNNTRNVLDPTTTNEWNISYVCDSLVFRKTVVNGPAIGGNFWSDYVGTDSGNDTYFPYNVSQDFIGDNLFPHTNGGNISSGGDFLPLVAAPADGQPFAWSVRLSNTQGPFSVDAINGSSAQAQKSFITVAPQFNFTFNQSTLIDLIDARIQKRLRHHKSCYDARLYLNGVFVTKQAKVRPFACPDPFSEQGTKYRAQAAAFPKLYDYSFYEPEGHVTDRVLFNLTSGAEGAVLSIRYRTWDDLIELCRVVTPGQGIIQIGNLSDIVSTIPDGEEIMIRDNNAYVLTFFGTNESFTQNRVSDANNPIWACVDTNGGPSSPGPNGICDASPLNEACHLFTAPSDSFAGGLNITGLNRTESGPNITLINSNFYCQNHTIVFKDDSRRFVGGKRYLRIVEGKFSQSNVDLESLIIAATSNKLVTQRSGVSGLGNGPNFTHFLFNGNGGGGFYVCPNVTAIDDLSPQCEGFVNFTGPFPQTLTVGGQSVTAVLDGIDYAFNFTGTGAELNGFTCGDTITGSINLTQSYNASGDCFVMNVTNSRLNCNGHSITGDGTGIGIQAENVRNLIIENCTIQLFETNVQFTGVNHSIIRNSTIRNATGSDPEGNGIIIAEGVNVTVHNTTLAFNGGSAISVEESRNITIVNNTLHNNVLGIMLELVNSTRLLSNIINSSDVALQIDTSFGTTIANLTMLGNNISIYVVDDFNVTINSTIASNIVFENSSESGGRVNFTFTINLSNTTNFQRLVSISHNRSFVNSTNATFLNGSATLTLFNITFDFPRALVDFDDDRVFANCDPPQCVRHSDAGSQFIFNVTGFTTYAATQGSPACGDTITSNVTMTESITGDDTCLTIGADNIFIDCNNFRIEYNRNGGDNEHGVVALGRSGVTIRNCIIVDINETGARNFGINFTSTNSSFIINNTIQTNGTVLNRGIFFVKDSGRSVIANNTIRSKGTSASNRGIDLSHNSSRNNITGNTITTNGTNDNYGIFAFNASDGNIIRSNRISTGGSAEANFGIWLAGGISDLSITNSVVANNTVVANGSDFNYGVRLTGISTANTIANNTIFTDGSLGNNFGIRIEGSSTGGMFDGNNITTAGGTNSYGISLTSSNNSAFSRTLLFAPVQWISSESNTFNNFTNTTFLTLNGSIRIFDKFQLNHTQDVNRSRLNVSSNNAFLNATNLTFLNTTAQITLNGISFTDPRPTVDLEDDGTFSFCSTPRCTEVSFTNNVFVYNVTSFTAYSSEESQVLFTNVTVTKTDSPDPVISGNLLNYSIVINNTGGAAAFNVSVVDTYPAQGSFNSSEPAPVSGTNNTFTFANISASSYVQINISFLVLSASSGNISNGALINNTVNVSFINSTGGNTSVRANISTTVQVPSTRIGSSPGATPNVFECGIITSNTVLGADVTSAGSCFQFGADSVSLDCDGHTITYGTGGLDLSYGVYALGRTGITIRNCIIQKLTNAGSYGVSIYFVNVTGSLVQNNTLLPRGTFNNYAVYMEASNTNRLINNTIATAGVTSGAFGFGNLGMSLFGTTFGSDNNNITDNFINTSGQDHNWGIYINASTGNQVRNNTISTMGTSLRNFGVHLRTSPANYITNNVVFTNGTDASGSQWYSSTDWGGSGSATGMNPGIRLDFDSDNNIVANNSILPGGRTTIGAATRNYAVYLVQGPSSNNITGNIIRTNGTNGENHGVRLHLSGTVSNLIENNNIRTTGGGSSNYGADIDTSADSTRIRNNLINTSGVGINLGVHIISASSALVENNQIFTSGTSSNNVGLYTDTSATSNTFNNNTIKTGGTSDNYGIQFAENTIPGSNIAENNTINASGSDGANHGIRFGVGSNDVYSDTARGNTITTSGPGGFSNHGILFSRGFRSFAVANTIQTGGLGTNRGVSIELTSSDNVIANNTIRTGGSSSSNVGVFTDTPSTRNNITGNTIRTNGTSTNYGVQVFDTEFVRVRDNTIFTTGSGASNHGIFIQSVGGSSDGAFGNIISGNLVNTNGSGTSSGIRLDGQISTRFVSNTVVANNTVFTNGTGATNIGIYLVAGASGAVFDNNVTNNTIVTNGTSDNAGIRMDTTTGTRVINNTIVAGGSSTGNDGIYMSGSSTTTAQGNNIQTAGSSSHAIRLDSSSVSTFSSHNITTSGTGSYGIAITSSSGIIFNNTLLSSPVQWISSNAGALNNFTNTTFATVSGSIRMIDLFNLNQTQDVNRNRLNVSFNRARVNATNLTFLNTTAQIVLNAITFTTPVPAVDLEDDGTFVQCSAPRCVNVSFVNNVFTFNVSSFTTYAAQEAPAACGQTLTSNTTLTQNVVGNVTCFTLGADNIFLDCDGFTIFYDGNGTGADGVVALNRNNITIRNCIIIDVNASGAVGIAINFTSVGDSAIINNTIQTNGTNDNYGILLFGTNGTVVQQNTVRTNGTDCCNYGVVLLGSNRNTMNNNSISTLGTSFNDAILLWNHNPPAGAPSTFNRVENNTIRPGGSGSDNVGVDILASSSRNLVINNTIRTNGTSANVGIFCGFGTITDTIIENNTILPNGTSSDNDGIEIGSGCTQLNITNNTISTDGTSDNDGIYFSSTDASLSRIENNTIRAYGTSTGNDGIEINSGIRTNLFRWNNISALGSGSDRGIYITAVGNPFGNIFTGNLITTQGPSGLNFGIYFENGERNNLTNNTIITNGSERNHGIRLDSGVSNANIFDANNITTFGAGSYGILTSARTVVFSNTLLSNTVEWINQTNTTGSPVSNFTNTSFITPNGSIRIVGLFQLNGSQEVNMTKLNISFNRAMLNATNLTFLNQSAQITFNSIVPANQTTIVALDDITFTVCSFQRCQNVSFVNGDFIFNVTSFTVYSTNGAPQPPFLRSPANNSFITNRTPLFVWDNSTDLENDVRTYTIQVSRNITFSDTVINVTNIAEGGPVNTSFPWATILDVDRTYYWRVQANDTFSTSNYSQIFNFTIQSFIALSLVNSLVNFSNVTRGVRVETNSSGGPPLPFVVQNDGNIEVNVTVTGTRLFVQAGFPSSAYQYNVSVNESNAFKLALSQTNFTNMTNASTAVDVRDLNWTDVNDTAAVHIAITAPLDEPGGNFTSNVTFTASIG